MGDTSERGFNVVGNTQLVNVQCPTCKQVTRVWSRNISWLCPFCGQAYQDIERYRVDKPTYRKYKQVQDIFSIRGLQKELWGLPVKETVIRSNQIVEEIRRGRVV